MDEPQQGERSLSDMLNEAASGLQRHSLKVTVCRVAGVDAGTAEKLLDELREIVPEIPPRST